MSYEYAGSLYENAADRDVAMVEGFIAAQGLEEGLENALELTAYEIFAEMADVGWTPDEGWSVDLDDLWDCALGRLVWSVRDELDMSQAELGEALGYNQRHISRLENGDRPVKPVVLRALQQLLSEGGQ